MNNMLNNDHIPISAFLAASLFLVSFSRRQCVYLSFSRRQCVYLSSSSVFTWGPFVVELKLS